MKRILFSADGSSGDLIPMVLMARDFQSAGYEVCVCGGEDFSGLAADFGVPYQAYPHNYGEKYLNHQRTGYIHNMRENIKHQESLYEGEYQLLSQIAPDFDVLINFLAEIFTPSIAEAYNLANIKLFTFPVIRGDLYGPPAGLPFVTENKTFNHLAWQGAIVAAKYLFKYYDTVNGLRERLKLPPLDDLLTNNSNCDHMMMGVYEELMPPCATWTFPHTYIGPCLPSDPVPLSDELEAFLAAGSKPIYIGFGSMQHADSEGLTKMLVQAVRDAGVRAIIAQATSTVGNGAEDADDIYVLREYPIPHHILFPRLKAAVHHGSWITTHLAARAGIPQLILPQASDQYMWSHALSSRGLGPKFVDMNRLKPHKLSAAIAELTSREDFAVNARELGEKVAGRNGVQNAVELFERIKGDLEQKRRARRRA